MAFRIYIVPKIGTGAESSPYRPKYFDVLSSRWFAMDYGFEPWFFVGSDLSSVDDAFISSQSDVYAIPFNLDANLTGPEVPEVQNKFESLNIPSGWVNSTLTWRSVMRTVLGMVTLMQRFMTLSGRTALFSGGVTLSTQMNQLPQTSRDNLLNAAISMGLNTSGIGNNSTLRNVLKDLSDQLQDRVFNFNGTLV